MAPGSHAIRPSVASQRDQVSSHSSGCSAGNSTCRARRAGAPVSAPEPLPRYRVPCRAPGSGRQGRVGTARGAHLFAERALRGQAARAHAQRRAAQRRDRLALPEWEEGRVRQHQHLARRAARRSAKAGSALARAAGRVAPAVGGTRHGALAGVGRRAELVRMLGIAEYLWKVHVHRRSATPSIPAESVQRSAARPARLRRRERHVRACGAGQRGVQPGQRRLPARDQHRAADHVPDLVQHERGARHRHLRRPRGARSRRPNPTLTKRRRG
jgi:hypothetical protein